MEWLLPGRITMSGVAVVTGGIEEEVEVLDVETEDFL